MALRSMKEALLGKSRETHIDDITAEVVSRSEQMESDLREKASRLFSENKWQTPQFADRPQHVVQMSTTCDFILQLEKKSRRENGHNFSALTDINLQFRSQDRTANLKQFLPVGKPIRFAYGENLAYHPDTQTITIPLDHTVDPFFPADLLHEIGHSHEEDRGGPSLSKRMSEIIGRSVVTIRNLMRGDLRGAKPFTGLENIPVERLREIHQKRAKDEIEAWKFAKQALQSLQRDGFDVMAAYGEHGLDDFIRTVLHDHQMSYERLVYLSGGPEALKNCDELFVWNE